MPPPGVHELEYLKIDVPRKAQEGHPDKDQKKPPQSTGLRHEAAKLLFPGSQIAVSESRDQSGTGRQEQQKEEKPRNNLLIERKRKKIVADAPSEDGVCYLGGRLVEKPQNELVHTPYQRPVGVLREDWIPVFPPDHLDDVPSGTPEGRFELLDYLAVTPNRAVEAPMDSGSSNSPSPRKAQTRWSLWSRMPVSSR
jgi:hypothetical protein